MKKVLIIVAVVAVGLVGIVKVLTISKAPAPLTTRAPGTRNSSSEPSPSASVPSGWKTYTSSKYGYSIQHPEGWTVDESQFESKQELLFVSANKDASLRINAFIDKAMNSKEAIQVSIDEFEKKMRAEPALTVAQFKGGVEGKTGGYIATGEQVINGESYVFENRGLLGTSGKVIIFHGIVKKTVTQQYGDTLSQMMKRFSLEK